MLRIRVVVVLIGLVMAFGPSPALAQGVKLTWWEHANPPHNAYSKDLVAEYNKGGHGASVEYEVFPMTPFFKKLTVAISTKTAPDMFTVTDFLLPSLVAKKGVAPLNPQWLGYQSLEDMKAAYLPGALNGYIYDGKIYAVPVIAQTMSLYLNRRHFEEAGLDPEKDYPRTWDDLARVGKKLVKSLADMKGLRLRSPGPQQTSLLRSWGVSPLQIQVTDLYDALQKGMADGALLPFSAIQDFKLFDVLKCHTVSNSYVMTAGLAMNLKTWNKLPPDVQKIFDELTGLKISEYGGAQNDRHSQLALEEIKRAGDQVYELPAAERKMWMDKAQPICGAWIADMEKKGLPGKKVYQEAVLLIEKYSKQ